MAEQRVPVLPVRVTFACDECGEEMQPTDYVLMTSPPQHPHRCASGHTAMPRREYPFIDYVEAPF